MPRVSPNMARLAPQRDATALEGVRWVLASASPRRRELLEKAGQDFDVIPSGAAEIPHADETGEARSRRLAVEKATEVAARIPGRWVLGADTLVLCEDAILGKPGDLEEARAMLVGLSGRRHRVVTGFALIGPDRAIVGEEAVVTVVGFRKLSDAEIDGYVESREWQDKAGAYAIQGAAAAFVSELRGSHSNVVGLPLEAVERVLREHGLWREVVP